MKINIFRNPFIHDRVSALTESYWRETIANELPEFGAKIESNMPNTTAGEIHHGEELLKQWAKYIISECERIVRKC